MSVFQKLKPIEAIGDYTVVNRMRRAFTLVELLVVLAIIAVLLAILVPTTQAVRRQSQSVKCKGQLQQIGQAVTMYLNQWDNRYPPARMGPAENPGPDLLPTLRDFVGGNASNVAEVWRCPNEEKLFEEFGLSYSYNQELGTVRLVDTVMWKMVKSTSLLPVAWDAENTHGDAKRKNFLMADGHVEEFLKNASPQMMN